MKMISIGHENYIPEDIITGIFQIGARPIRGIISRAQQQDKLIDATKGKKTKSVILTRDGYVILSSIKSITIAERIEQA